MKIIALLPLAGAVIKDPAPQPSPEDSSVPPTPPLNASAGTNVATNAIGPDNVFAFIQ